METYNSTNRGVMASMHLREKHPQTERLRD